MEGFLLDLLVGLAILFGLVGAIVQVVPGGLVVAGAVAIWGVVTGGTLDATAARDGLKSDNEEDPERGYVAIRGGDVTISSGDDAIKGYTDVVVDDGTVERSEAQRKSRLILGW